jgi:hypothetical protein
MPIMTYLKALMETGRKWWKLWEILKRLLCFSIGWMTWTKDGTTWKQNLPASGQSISVKIKLTRGVRFLSEKERAVDQYCDSIWNLFSPVYIQCSLPVVADGSQVLISDFQPLSTTTTNVTNTCYLLSIHCDCILCLDLHKALLYLVQSHAVYQYSHQWPIA